MTMILKDVSFKTPQENILYDEVLLDSAERGLCGEALRFWESQEIFIVLGRISRENEDIRWDNVRRDAVPVLRRASGGGTVLQGKGCLSYSLILSKDRDPQMADLRKSYQYILGKFILALGQLGVAVEFFPISDLALKANGKKISGNAQKRSRTFVLHHGTILYDFDLTKIQDYLNMPADAPPYRQGRRHLDFVANIPSTAGDMKKAIGHMFCIDRIESKPSNHEKDCLETLMHSKKICVQPSPAQ